MNRRNEVTGENIELDEHSPNLIIGGSVTQALAPTDSGKDAYMVLAGCFLAEVFTWALPYSYGVFQAYYTRHETFPTQTRGVAAVGTILVGLMMGLSPFPAMASQMWPHLRRSSMAFGLVLASSSLVAASYCTRVDALIATQGVLYAVGCVIAYFPCFIFLDEWFVRRKGLAYGVAWAGTGFGGSATPFILDWLLSTYGPRVTLRIWAVVQLVGVGTAILLVRNRLPTSGARTLRSTDVAFLKYPPFWVFETANIIVALGAYLPMLYIPTFAASIGLPAFSGPVALALYSISTFCGCLLLGSLVDHFHVCTVILLSTLCQLIAIFVFWGLTNGQVLLYLFAILYGVFGGASFATWPGCSLAIKKAIPGCHVDTGFVLSLLTAGKGLGSVASGPLSTALLQSGWQVHTKLAYGSDFGAIIVFTGISAMLGIIACVGRLFRLV